MHTSKKKLSQTKAGKLGLRYTQAFFASVSLYLYLFPSIRAPSLDTINRTYRNIDIAIQQQVYDVTQLTTRLAKLKVTTPRIPTATRDARLPDPVSKRPFNITPHVAAATAAALNAERSAQKLKRTLLAVREEPLLNSRATSAPAAPVAFKTPQKTTVVMPVPNWDIPKDDFNPSSPSSSGRRGAGVGSKRQRSVPLPVKKNPGQVVQNQTTPVFDWGPLPNFNTKPVPTMEAKSNTVSGGNALGDSWVTDDFNKEG